MESMESTETIKILPAIPLDIQLTIISKLEVKTIRACKCLSKAFNKLISDPLFSHIYRSNHNNSSSLDTIFINSYDLITCYITTSHGYKRDHSIFSNLVEFKRDIYDNNSPDMPKHACVTPKRLLKDYVTILKNITNYSIWGSNCNGLICLLRREFFNIYNFFIANPITGDIIELPDPVNKRVIIYGLGYCQFTDRYKALRIIGLNEYEHKSEILTIGVDKYWRKVLDINVPYNLGPQNFLGRQGSGGIHPYIVALRSAIHWLAQPIPMSEWIVGAIPIEWGGTRYICAFDMTEERVRALRMPQQVGLRSFGYGLGVLLDKLCFWELLCNNDCVNVWIMDEYGVEESWTKRSVLKVSALPPEINLFRLTPLAMSVEEGVILISDNKRLMIYDMVINSLKGIHFYDNANCTIPIVPDFVSFKNRPGWLTDV